MAAANLFDDTMFEERAGEITAARKKMQTYKPISDIPKKRAPGTWQYMPKDVVNDLAEGLHNVPSTAKASIEDLYNWLNQKVMAMGPSPRRNKYEKRRDEIERQYYVEGAMITPPTVTPTVVYAGTVPVATVFNYEGETYLINDLSGNAMDLLNIRKTLADAPLTLQDFMTERGYTMQDATQSQAWIGLDRLISGMSGEWDEDVPLEERVDLPAKWREGGVAESERLMGFAPGTYDEKIGGMEQILSAGIHAGQGLSAQEKDLYRRRTGRGISRMGDEAKKIVEAFAGAGQDTRAFEQMDTALQRIGDYQLQSQLEMANLDFLRKEAEFKAVDDRYKYMVNMGQMTVSNYIERQRQHAGFQVALFATRLQQIESANRQILTERQSDMQALREYANSGYEAMTAALTQDAAATQNVRNYYDNMMAPWVVQLQNDALALEANQLAMDQEQQMWNNAFSIFQSVAGIVTGAGEAVAGVATAT